jgi:hypothetical protein
MTTKKAVAKADAQATPAAFLGGEIIGGIAGEFIKMGVGKAMEAVAADPGNKLAQKDVASATIVAAKALAENPVAVNATNQEPWYASRVLVGNSAASVGIVMNAGVLLLRGVGFHIEDSSVAWLTEVIAAFFTVAGVLLSFYGRLKSGLAPLFGWLHKT